MQKIDAVCPHWSPFAEAMQKNKQCRRFGLDGLLSTHSVWFKSYISETYISLAKKKRWIYISTYSRSCGIIGIFPLHKSGTKKEIQQSSWLTSKRLLGRSTPSQVVMVHGSTRGMRLDSADPMATSGLQRDNPQPWLLDSDEWCQFAECSFNVFTDFWCICSTQRGYGTCWFFCASCLVNANGLAMFGEGWHR